jgi:uncharacterized Zn-binding protein involved in type VI secretion
MLRRYHITLGAGTTAGGLVKTASAPCSILGVKLALEGDKVSCPVCGAEGTIKCDGPRLSEKWNGKQVALQDDLCLCKCSPPPRLIAIQQHKSQLINAEQRLAEAAAAAEAAERASRPNSPRSADRADELPIRFIDNANDEPLRHKKYRLEFPGKVVDGVTDADGYTQPISRDERAALIAWDVEGQSRAA